MDTDRDIPRKIRDSFNDSLAKGYIHLYHTVDHHLVQHDPVGFPQLGNIVPQLSDKPQVPPSTPDLSTRRLKDPLQGPHYGRGEHVLDLVHEPSGAQYAIVHNLHALAPEHCLVVPCFDPDGEGPHMFRPQTSALTEDDLWTAWRVVKAYADEGRETTAFFNGGPLAGASQPHLHIQFIPFQHHRAPGPEHLARSLAPLAPAPVSHQPGAQPVPARLPVPWVDFYLPLPFSGEAARSSSSNGPTSTTSTTSSPSSSPTSHPSLSTLTPSALHRTYLSLLASRDALIASHLAADPDPAVRARVRVPSEDGGRRGSHNVFLTSRHLHVVPRRERLVVVPRGGEKKAREAAAGSSGDKDEDDQAADPSDASFAISLNGLVYLGYWAASSESDWADLCELGLAQVLTRAGYENDEFGGGGEGEGKGKGEGEGEGVRR